MPRHIFIGPAMPGTTNAQLEEVVRTLRQLPHLLPEISKFSVETTLGLSGEERGVVLIAEFDSAMAWEHDMHDPKHLALGDKIKDHIDLSRMTLLQTDIDADGGHLGY